MVRSGSRDVAALVVKAPRQRIKVLTLIDQLIALGGAERIAMDIAVRLNPDRFESVLCASRSTEGDTSVSVEAAERELRAAGIRYLGLGRRGKLDPSRWVPLYRMLRHERFDVIHSHMFGSNVWGVVVGHLARVPVLVAHEHTWSFEGHPVRRLLDRELIGRASDVFVAVSAEDRRKMIEVEGLKRDKVLVVPNGIAAPPAGETGDIRSELGIPGSAPVVGAVGVLRPQKALDVLLRATAMLMHEFEALRVVIVGDGPDRHSLAALARQLGIEDRVILTGFRSDVPSILPAVDVAVSSSAFEGSPLATMEFMEAALPIVATRVGGVPDLIDDGVHGLLVEAGDVEGLAGGVRQMLTDRSAAHTMGQRARERRRSEFSVEVMVNRFESLYERLRGGEALPASAAELDD